MNDEQGDGGIIDKDGKREENKQIKYMDKPYTDEEGHQKWGQLCDWALGGGALSTCTSWNVVRLEETMNVRAMDSAARVTNLVDTDQ